MCQYLIKDDKVDIVCFGVHTLNFFSDTALWNYFILCNTVTMHFSLDLDSYSIFSKGCAMTKAEVRQLLTDYVNANELKDPENKG